MTENEIAPLETRAVGPAPKVANEVIAEALEKMGGIDALVKWADNADEPRNAQIFWGTIFPRLLIHDSQVKREAGRIAQVVFKGLNDGGE